MALAFNLHDICGSERRDGRICLKKSAGQEIVRPDSTDAYTLSSTSFAISPAKGDGFSRAANRDAVRDSDSADTSGAGELLGKAQRRAALVCDTGAAARLRDQRIDPLPATEIA